MPPDTGRQQLRSVVREAAASGDAANTLKAARELLATSDSFADVKFCATIFSEISAALTGQLKARTLRTFVARSITIEPLLPYLTVEATLSNLVLDLRLGGYGSYFDEMLNPQSELGAMQPDLVLLLLDLEDIAGRLADRCADGIGAHVQGEIDDSVARMEQLISTFRASSSARLVVQGCVIPDHTSLGEVADANLPHSLPNAVAELNRRLAALCRATPDCVFFDVDRLAARHGRMRWRDQRLFLASRLAVSAEAFPHFTRGLIRTVSSLVRPARKVLCTDLDNTLWGGILGEDGPEGIATGSAFPGNSYLEYQRYLKHLSARGILLAIVSKNNESDVLEAFTTRASDLGLTLKDFVATRISWQEKTTSLRELAQELSLGLDSFVFVDDNPVECAAVREALPEIAVVEAPVQDPWRLVEILAAQPFFDATSVTEDDLNRLADYKAQAQRAEMANSAGSRDEFLASLDIVCTFLSALEAPLARSVQLLAKTNQFNVTTRRYSASEIEAIATHPGGLAIAVRVRDRFGDAGVVGLALAQTEGNVCRIDSLLLSCRVIGRGIEAALLYAIAQHALRSGVHRLLGEFLPSKKNAPAAAFYKEHGFRELADAESSGGALWYEYDLSQQTPECPSWLTLEGIESHELSGSPVLSS